MVNDSPPEDIADNAIIDQAIARTSADGGLVLEGHYAGKMDMAADVDTVGRYLNSHQGWFTRCAHPMQVDPIADHGYALVVGHFAMLGHEVEPKVGLYLSSLDHRVYRIDTMPIPGYVAPGYDVDFHSVLELKEGAAVPPPAMALTEVDWELSLAVKIHMPRLLGAVPRSLLKSSGDRLLNQVVRQVSKRLTRRVQEDFHTSHNLPLPESYRGHHFWSNWGRKGSSTPPDDQA
ncbi:MAG: hypothetical protein DCF17_12535 [Shackletoniella antarctica]|uniref:DUF1997 domain-containing protein n=1 Tax=Shackletoniella antarctica TaxID=268115 RepID=A0A2W4W5Y8_9CYAN|nr:MAG: hypothetical protein DCF17_12535 [Shackletoniella antarctica]